jgi:hypothetical protein
MKRSIQLLLSLLLLVVLVPMASAQASRTWVSGVGDDANPCSRTAPCKTFAGAISKTAAGGEIDALDPGGFGAVTITKAITIDGGGGQVASVLASGTNGIVIQAPATAAVTLRNLRIMGISGTGLGGLSGVRFTAGARLVVDHCTISDFINNGIDFEPNNAAVLAVSNTIINNITGNAVLVLAGATGTVNGALDHVQLLQSVSGLVVQKGTVAMKSSVVSGMSSIGVNASGSAALAHISLDDTVVSDGAGTAVNSVGSQAAILMSRSTITANSVGLHASLSGTITSFSNNRLLGNTSTSTPTSTVTEQ